MNEVIVEYDYVAKESDELTLKKGDIIKDVIKKPGGWWEGVLKDKKGMFPDNFVQPLDKDAVVLRNNKDVSRIRQCRVVFSYNQDHEDELNLKVGDVIEIVGEEEEGWWRGTLNGKEGVFPSNFVKEIPWQPNASNRIPSANLVNENDTPPKLPLKPTKQLCEATYPYKAQNDDELSFKEGDILTLLNKDSQDPGWWQGELHGKIGVFPDNFVVLICNSDNKGSNKEDRKSLSRVFPEAGAIKVVSVASQRKSLEPRIEKNDGDISISNKSPPIPSKKPIVSVKKSPSSSGVGLISEIKKKIVDVVDGTAGSKSVQKEQEMIENADNAFDQVERRPLLADVRATRAKAPGRRPPTTIMHKDDESTISNGNVEATSHNHQIVDLEIKPRLREWEKHKAPWLEEMKQNQVKRTTTSSLEHLPEEENKLTKTQNEKEVDPPKSISPLNPNFKVPHQSDRVNQVPVRHSLTHMSKDIPKDLLGITSQATVMPKDSVTLKVSPTKPTIISTENSKNHTSHADILERLEMLEEAVEKQNQIIEDLRNRLQVEIDMRMFLQEKIMQNVQV